MQTSKEIVLRTLEFNNPERAPRDLWALPWAGEHYPEELKNIRETFEWDFAGVTPKYESRAKTSGDPYAVGTYIDDWGCIFENKQSGVIGEVRTPIVDDDWKDLSKVHIPKEWLSFDIDDVNRKCVDVNDKFIMGGVCPRPFERLQFLRGSENLYIDLMLQPKGFLDFINSMHEFYCELLLKWAKTDVDALNMMDDWGSQNSLLINPKLWEKMFKPLYKDYIDIAHSHGKKIFMHSDGYTVDIYPHLIELGLDAFNSQIFCMGLDKLEQFKGKITFWGEIDRQHLLPNASVEEINAAVKQVKSKLWANGGCIAQCEFGAGAKPENVFEVYKAWDEK